MNFESEKEFEDQLYDCIRARKQNPLNGRRVLSVIRQAGLGEYGIADIITLELMGDKQVINVIELKNVPFSIANIFQTKRYMAAVQMGADYKLCGNGLLDFDLDNHLQMFPEVKVIGSIVCTQVGELADGVLAALEDLNIAVYRADMEMLSVFFEPESQFYYSPDAVKVIQSTISALAEEIEFDEEI